MAEEMTRTQLVKEIIEIEAEARRLGKIEGLRLAEEIAEKLSANSGYHPYTREGAERAALAIRSEREKLERG